MFGLKKESVEGTNTVSGEGEPTYVDHDSLLAHLLQSESRTDGAPIELDGASDSIYSRPENDN